MKKYSKANIFESNRGDKARLLEHFLYRRAWVFKISCGTFLKTVSIKQKVSRRALCAWTFIRWAYIAIDFTFCFDNSEKIYI